MSSRYPILQNRPIDQWKVTELKEELKRRKLTTKGLKDDLIKRLDEALRIEREAAKKDELNIFYSNSQPVVGPNNSQTVTVDAEVGGQDAKIVDPAEEDNTAILEPNVDGNTEKIPETMVNDSIKNDNVDFVTIATKVNNSVPAMDPEVGDNELPAGLDSVSVGKDLNIHSSTLEASITVTESVLTEVVVSGQEPSSTETQKDIGDFSAMKLDNEESKPQPETEDSKPQQDCDMEPLHEDAIPNSSSAPGNQVSEVNPILGSQLKSDSISSDSVSINEKNELKDNIIADNVKLEQNIVKPEMVEPSSSNFVPGSGESHSMNVGEQDEKRASVEENSGNNVTSPDLNKTNSSEDVGYAEKLNLDRSSGDDSMEEDLLESKQFDSKFNVDELRDKKDGSLVNIVEEERVTEVVVDDLSAVKSDSHENNVIHPVAPAEKRKFIDQVSVGSNEPAKRQRRWNSENVKVPGPQSASLSLVTTPKDEPVALKRNFSRSSATDDAPKERIVPPSQRSPTNSLRIDRFLRPFTLKAVQELLGKTGNVISFWMDHVKTHCYVTFSSVEEAIKTRDAVYNLQWPPNGGRLLVAEFVDPQEVKVRTEAPPTQAASVSTGHTVPSAPPTSQPEPSPRQHREQPPVPHALPPPPLLSKAPPAVRERLPLPPPVAEKVEPPIVTLDDLFRKTRATPRIYYLPLSEEQVAAKLAAQGKTRKP